MIRIRLVIWPLLGLILAVTLGHPGASAAPSIILPQDEEDSTSDDGNTPDDTGTPDQQGASDEAASSGEAGGTDPGSFDSGAQPGVSTPRVMLTAFGSEPAQVAAGETFKVSFTLQNMSSSTRVRNLKVTLTSDGASFLPVEGSTSAYISSIKAEGSVSRTMSFRALEELETRPYQLMLLIEYEDGDANPYSSQETVAIAVTQPLRASTSTLLVSPEVLTIGQQGSVTFTINNLGKSKIYNATVGIKEGQPITGPDVFIGTIEPGTSSQVDLLIQAEQESSEPATILITYEDAADTASTMEQTVALAVEPQAPEEAMPEEAAPMEEPTGFPMTTLVGASVLVAVVTLAVILILRARRRRRQRADLATDISVLESNPLVPPDQP
ncbi:MAG: COG1361 S-layer family protein [Arachnia sp.]